MDEKTKGAWIFHHSQKLQGVTNSIEYERIVAAGKAGLLLSGLAASETSELSNDKVAAIARAAGISPLLELSPLLDRLSEARLLSRSKSGVAVLGITSAAVLSHTSQIFGQSDPSSHEHAVIELAECTSAAPLSETRAVEYLSDTCRLPADSVKDLLKQSEDIGFVDAEGVPGKERLFFNGNLFRRGAAEKTNLVLSSLSSDESRRVAMVDAELRQRGCVPLEEVAQRLGEPVLRKMQAVGMYDVSEVANSSDSAAFVTRPAAFVKFGNPFVDDALDMAKSFVACLSYGMTRSRLSRGRITMLQRLVRKLIDGQWVGPATAIGEDYRVLELNRVVELQAEGPGSSRYLMRLLKRDVGEIALQVLTTGDASDQALDGLPGAVVTRYRSPEANRSIMRRKQTAPSRRATGEILLALRTGK